MGSVNATARGTLATTPLWELFVFCLDRQLSGTLVIESSEGRSALTLSEGAVVKAKLSAGGILLGQVCIDMGFIEQADLQAVLDRQLARPIGETLRDLGLIDQEQLRAALQEQLLQQVEWCGRLPEQAIYGYYQGQNFLERWGGIGPGVDPLRAIWRCAANSMTAQRATTVVTAFGDRVLRLHPRARVGRFGFDAGTSAALDVLRAKPQSYRDLVGTRLAPADLLNRVLAVLALTRHLDLGGQGVPLAVETGNPEAGGARATVAAPRVVAKRHKRAGEPSAARSEPEEGDAEAVARRKEVTEMAARVGSLDFYALLGVGSGADPSAIQSAFFQLAKRWHPDRLPQHMKDLKDACTRVFARMTEAHQVLSNSSKRAEYDRLMAEGTSSEEEQEKVQRVLRAATAFQKAEVLARRMDWEGALPFAEKAYRDDPEQAEYGALFAWIAAHSKHRTQSDAELVEMLNDAVKAQRDNIRIRTYRAEVLGLVGKAGAALRDFRFIHDKDPRNVDAARAIRLAKMRSQESEGESEGLFGKLFKR